LPGLIEELGNAKEDNDEFGELVQEQYLKPLKVLSSLPFRC